MNSKRRKVGWVDGGARAPEETQHLTLDTRHNKFECLALGFGRVLWHDLASEIAALYPTYGAEFLAITQPLPRFK